MAVKCSLCGGTRVACSALVNPNTKVMETYAPDAFTKAVCHDCNKTVVVSDVERVQKQMRDKYLDFCAENGHSPKVAECHIAWKDNHTGYDVRIQLSSDSNPDEDDNIFFYCDSLNDFLSLAGVGMEDFIITEIHSFEEE